MSEILIKGNIVLDLKTFCRREKTLEDKFEYEYPVNYYYSLNNSDEKNFADKYFEQMVTNYSQREKLRECLGRCLIPNSSDNKLYTFIGNGMSGKTTLIAILQLILGNKLKYINQNFFKTCQLTESEVNAQVLVCNEFIENNESEPFEIHPYFKSLISQESTIVKNRKDCSYMSQPHCQFILLLNEMPKCLSNDAGLKRRRVYINFNGQMTDPNYLKNLTLEQIDQIFTWMVFGAFQFLNRGGN